MAQPRCYGARALAAGPTISASALGNETTEGRSGAPGSGSAMSRGLASLARLFDQGVTGASHLGLELGLIERLQQAATKKRASKDAANSIFKS